MSFGVDRLIRFCVLACANRVGTLHCLQLECLSCGDRTTKDVALYVLAPAPLEKKGAPRALEQAWSANTATPPAATPHTLFAR